MPVGASGSGPAKRTARQPRLALIPAGTQDSAQTTDSSSGVRVIDHQGAAVAHIGTGSPASRRQIAIDSGNSVRESRRAIRLGSSGVCRAHLAFALALTQHAPLYLAGRRHGQRAAEFDLLGILVGREKLPHVTLDVFLESARGRLSRPPHDED